MKTKLLAGCLVALFAWNADAVLPFDELFTKADAGNTVMSCIKENTSVNDFIKQIKSTEDPSVREALKKTSFTNELMCTLVAGTLSADAYEVYGRGDIDLTSGDLSPLNSVDNSLVKIDYVDQSSVTIKRADLGLAFYSILQATSFKDVCKETSAGELDPEKNWLASVDGVLYSQIGFEPVGREPSELFESGDIKEDLKLKIEEPYDETAIGTGIDTFLSNLNDAIKSDQDKHMKYSSINAGPDSIQFANCTATPYIWAVREIIGKFMTEPNPSAEKWKENFIAAMSDTKRFTTFKNFLVDMVVHSTPSELASDSEPGSEPPAPDPEP